MEKKINFFFSINVKENKKTPQKPPQKTKTKNKQHVYYTIFIFFFTRTWTFFGDNLRITMRIITKTEIIIYTVDSRFKVDARIVKKILM